MSALTPYPLRPSRFRRAFTLLELLVAVALLGVIILGLLAMFTQVQRAWKSGITQVDVMEGGRATMAQVVRDLQDMTVGPTTNATNFQVVFSANSTSLLLDLPDGSTRANELQELSFLTRDGDAWIGVAYRVSNAVAGAGTLYRLTTTTVSSNPNDLTSYRRYPTNVAQMSRTIMSVTPAALNDTPLDPANNESALFYSRTDFHRVADGVVNFTINAYNIEGKLLTNSVVDSANNFTGNLNDFNGYVCRNYLRANNEPVLVLPAYVEVELAVVEPAVLDRFNVRAELDATPNKQSARAYLRKKAGQVHIFRQRVPIRPAATTVGPLLPGS